jgi:hypothetical protein
MTKVRNILLAMVAVSAISVGTVSSASADCGIIGCVLNKVIPGSGDLADGWSREWQKRDSDASVGSQILGARLPDAPFRPAPGAGPAPAYQPMPAYALPPPALMGNLCRNGYMVSAPGAWLPVGSPCSSNGQQFGFFRGYVSQS